MNSPTIKLEFSYREYKELVKEKGSLSWEEFFLSRLNALKEVKEKNKQLLHIDKIRTTEYE